jgi:arsenate reductase (glutaredoxin)
VTSPTTIFHNPACGTSRQALAMIRAADHEPEVVEYLKVGWRREQLTALLERMGLTPRDVLRLRGAPDAALGLAAPTATDDEIVDAMVRHPILVERPIVVGPRGAALCRPAEKVLALL